MGATRNFYLEGIKNDGPQPEEAGISFGTRGCWDLLKFLGCCKRQIEHQKFDLNFDDLGVLHLVLQSGWMRFGPAKKNARRSESRVLKAINRDEEGC
jgi:hypothetical protein